MQKYHYFPVSQGELHPGALQESNGVFLFPLFLPSRSGLYEAAGLLLRFFHFI